MRIDRVLLLSISLNALLLVGVFRELASRPQAQGEAREITTAEPARPLSKQWDGGGQPAAPASWSLVEREDLGEYVANLEAIGCPSETIRLIVFAEANRQFLVRRAAMPVHTNFWMTGPEREIVLHRAREEERQLERDMQARVRDVLGVDWYWSDRARRDVNDTLSYVAGDFLSDEQAVRAGDVMKKYRRLGKREGNPLFGIVTPDDVSQGKARSEQLNNELAEILTPAQLEELRLRFHAYNVVDVWSVAAQYGSDLTGAELREILRITRRDEDPLGRLVGHEERPAPDPARQQAQDAAVRALLGEERFQGYQTAKDFEFRFLHRYVAGELKLPSATAVALHNARRLTESQAAQLRADQALRPDQRRVALEALQAEAAGRARGMVPEQAWSAYRKDQGAWMDKLTGTKP